MNIDINLNSQPDKPWSKISLKTGSIITLLLSAATAIVLFLNLASSVVLLWFYMFYFLIISFSLFIQSRGKHIFDFIGKSYLKVEDDTLEHKPQMISKKVVKIHWKDIEEVKVKLFEVHLKLKNRWEMINLEKLSDDNLKLVKQRFQDYAQKLNQEKLALTG